MKENKRLIDIIKENQNLIGSIVIAIAIIIAGNLIATSLAEGFCNIMP